VKLRHPHVEIRKGYCGGSPAIAGTKFPVRSVVHYVLNQGMSPEELVKEFEHLTLAQVHDALSYCYDHQAEMDRELEEHTEERGVLGPFALQKTDRIPVDCARRASVPSQITARSATLREECRGTNDEPSERLAGTG